MMETVLFFGSVDLRPFIAMTSMCAAQLLKRPYADECTAVIRHLLCLS